VALPDRNGRQLMARPEIPRPDLPRLDLMLPGDDWAHPAAPATPMARDDLAVVMRTARPMAVDSDHQAGSSGADELPGQPFLPGNSTRGRSGWLRRPAHAGRHTPGDGEVNAASAQLP